MDTGSIVRLIQAGYTAYQVARELGITPAYVRQVVRNLSGPRNLQRDFDQAAMQDDGLGRKGLGQKRRRTDYSGDPSAYQQVSYHSTRSGRNRFTTKKLLLSNVTRTDFWFKGLKAFDDSGFYWMNKSNNTTNTPVGYMHNCYIFAPFHVKQSAAVARPFRRIMSGSSNNAFRSESVEGQNSAGALSAELQVLETSANVNQVNMGACGMLRWTEMKFNLWGAKGKSVRWFIDFVKPVSEGCNPFSYAAGTPFSTACDSQFQEYLRPKCVNPLSTANDMSPSGWRIIKRHVYDIDPIDLGEVDTDPHVKQVTLFNRWDRLIRFDWTVSTTDESALTFVDASKNVSESGVTYSAVRPEEDKDIFVIICGTNYGPYNVNAEASNGVDGSFDMTFRSSWSRLG